MAADATDRVAKLTEEVMAASRANRELMGKLIASEVDRAAAVLGFVRAEELDDLRRELSELRMSMAHAAAQTDVTDRRSGDAEPLRSTRSMPCDPPTNDAGEERRHAGQEAVGQEERRGRRRPGEEGRREEGRGQEGRRQEGHAPSKPTAKQDRGQDSSPHRQEGAARKAAVTAPAKKAPRSRAPGEADAVTEPRAGEPAGRPVTREIDAAMGRGPPARGATGR